MLLERAPLTLPEAIFLGAGARLLAWEPERLLLNSADGVSPACLGVMGALGWVCTLGCAVPADMRRIGRRDAQRGGWRRLHPPCIPAGSLGLVLAVAGEMPDHGVALLDVRGGNMPAATERFHAGLNATSDGHHGISRRCSITPLPSGCPFSHCSPPPSCSHTGDGAGTVNVPKLQLLFGLFILFGLITPRKSL